MRDLTKQYNNTLTNQHSLERMMFDLEHNQRSLSLREVTAGRYILELEKELLEAKKEHGKKVSKNRSGDSEDLGEDLPTT